MTILGKIHSATNQKQNRACEYLGCIKNNILGKNTAEYTPTVVWSIGCMVEKTATDTCYTNNIRSIWEKKKIHMNSSCAVKAKYFT